jgi:hypothetical protein
MAHPVISTIQVGKEILHEIHCNISSSSHCIYDVSAVSGPAADVNVVTADDDYCCQDTRFKAKNFEMLVPGAMDVNNFQFLPEELERLTEDIILPISKTKVDRADELIVDNKRLFLNGFNPALNVPFNQCLTR